MEFKDSIASIVMTSLTSVGLGYYFPQYTKEYTIPLIGIGFVGLCYSTYKLLYGKDFELFVGAGLKNKKDDYPLFKYREKTDKGYNYYFSLPSGLSIDDFNKHKQAIINYFGVKDVNIKYEKYRIILELIDKKLESNCKFELIKDCKGNLPIVIGRSFDKLEILDLSHGEPHMLIAGESGSGKSTLLRVIITHLICNMTNKIDLHLIDLKNGAEFGLFEKCKNIASFSKNKNEALKTLNKISKEIDKRYNLFYENECVDITEYNKKFKHNKLKLNVVIIDEFAELRDNDKSINLLESMAARARACGIHLIISTQRPDAKVITGSIKANIPRIVGLKTMNGTNSRIIIDHNGLESLRGSGHCILVNEGKETECQVFNLSAKEARDIVKQFYQENNKPRITHFNGIEIKKKNKINNNAIHDMEDASKYDNLDFFDKF